MSARLRVLLAVLAVVAVVAAVVAPEETRHYVLASAIPMLLLVWVITRRRR